MEVNASVAEFHRLDGFEVRPPFVEDHRDGRVPAYADPRLWVLITFYLLTLCLVQKFQC